MLTKKGQANIEALLILSAVLITVASLQIMGENMVETNTAITSAEQRVQTGVTRLAMQNEIGISISDWELNGENIIFYLKVQGDPPPENEYLTSFVEEIAQTHVGPNYTVIVEIGSRVTK